MFIDYTPVPNCKNPDTYGMICVKCNECGRWNNTEQLKDSAMKDKIEEILDSTLRSFDEIEDIPDAADKILALFKEYIQGMSNSTHQK